MDIIDEAINYFRANILFSQFEVEGGADLTLHEVAEAARTIADSVDPDANIISGLVVDEDLVDEAGIQAALREFPELFHVVGEAAAGSAHREARPDDRRDLRVAKNGARLF